MSRAMIEDVTQPQRVRMDEACPVPPGAITSRPLVDHAQVRQVLFAMDAGQEMSEHKASFPAIVHVLSGRLDFTIAGQQHDLRGGDWLFMPADAAHALRALEPTRFLLTLAKG